MEEAIRESEGQQEPAAPAAATGAAAATVLPPAQAPKPTRTPSPRTAQLLREVEEITLVLVAVHMAWERFACDNFPTLMRATAGRLRCEPWKLKN
eukprot:12432418-Alexandrium_andersonii.AAC.1